MTNQQPEEQAVRLIQSLLKHNCVEKGDPDRCWSSYYPHNCADDSKCFKTDAEQILALVLRLGYRQEAPTEGYWWCPNCKEELGWHHVTYQELCTTCGHPVEWIELKEAPAEEIRKFIDEEADYYAHEIVVPITGEASNANEEARIEKYKAEFTLFGDKLLCLATTLIEARIGKENVIPGWAEDTTDRISYNADGETLDEAVMFGANVHLEQMTDNSFMLIIQNHKQMWHLVIHSRSGRAKVDAKLYESEPEYLGNKTEGEKE